METTCVSCGNTFEREKKRGRPATKCLSCRENKATVLQFAKAGGDTVELKIEEIDGVTWIQSTEPCKDCGATFMRPRKRGKPPVRCESCKSKQDAAKAAEITTSEERLEELYRGPKALLKGTPSERPRGGEAQCPRTGKCERIFTSNTACDEHKRWLPNGTYECIDPATLGMEPRARTRDKDKPEERIVPVWTRPTPEEE